VIAPLLDGAEVKFVGEINESAKTEFLGRAAGLLFPIDWPEPFGLVMIEAMACGTPVLAFRAGSVPEIVEDGLTGRIVSNIEEAVQAVPDLLALDRKAIRARFEQRFSGAWQRTTLEYTRCSEGTPPRKSSSPLPPCQRPRRWASVPALNLENLPRNARAMKQ
jgi:glycosyltransferase involved in cell wall biosynthesis